MLVAYNNHGNVLRPGQLIPGRDGALYEFIEVTSAPTGTTFGKVRMRQIWRESVARYTVAGAYVPRYSSQVFADIAFGLTIR